MKVLYVNHYGVLGGAQRSLLELITSFPKDAIEPYFFTPGGSITKYLERLNIPYSLFVGGVTKFDHTKLGYYRGFRWFIIGRELFYLLPTLYTFFRFRKKAREFDIIHINEITCLLPIILAKKLYKKPVIVHARVVFRNDPQKKRTSFVLNVLNKYADRVIAIDENVADSLPANNISVVHNSFSRNNFFTQGADLFKDKIAFIPRGRLHIGFMGAIHHNKGIFELLETAKLCKENNMDVRFLIAGTADRAKKSLSHSLLKKFGIAKDGNIEFYSYIQKNNLQSYVFPLGRSSKTDVFFQNIDAICFPSFSDALGRPVFEAGFFRKPAIVAVDRIFADTFIEGKTGLNVEAGNACSIFNAIKIFYDQPMKMKEMGEHAFELASRNFDGETNAAKVLDIYESVITLNRLPQHVYSRT